MVFLILRSDEGQPSCVRPTTLGGAYLNMATQTVCALKHQFEFHHLESYLDNRNFGKRFRGKVLRSDCYHNRMCIAQSLMRRGTIATLLSEESDSCDCFRILVCIPSEEMIHASEHITDKELASQDESIHRLHRVISNTSGIDLGKFRTDFKDANLRWSWYTQTGELERKHPKQQKAEFLRYTSDKFQQWIDTHSIFAHEIDVDMVMMKLNKALFAKEKRKKDHHFPRRRKDVLC